MLIMKMASPVLREVSQSECEFCEMCRSMNMYTLIKFPPWVGKAPWRLARLWSQVQNSNLRQTNTFKVKTPAQVSCPPASMNFLVMHEWKALPTMDMSTGEPAALKANSHLLATCSMASDTNRPEAGMFCSHISLILASLQPPRHCVCGQDLCRSPGTGPWDYTGSHPYLHCSNLHSLLTVPAAANIDLKINPCFKYLFSVCKMSRLLIPASEAFYIRPQAIFLASLHQPDSPLPPSPVILSYTLLGFSPSRYPESDGAGLCSWHSHH